MTAAVAAAPGEGKPGNGFDLSALKPGEDEITMPRAPFGDPALVSRFKRSLLEPKNKRELMRLLQKTFLFADTSEEFRTIICDQVWPMNYLPDQIVFRHGELGNWMAVIISGRLKRMLQRKNIEIAIGDLGPGAIIGDIGLFGLNRRRSFTVVALTEVTVLIVTRECLNEAVQNVITRLPGPGVSNFSKKSVTMFKDAEGMQDLMQDTDSFLKLDCFKGLDRDFVMTLREHSEPRLCYPNQVLMRENAYGNEMYVLRAGTVKVEKQGKFICDLSSGVVLGELAVLGSDKRRMATVICTSLCLFRVLHGDDFHQLLASFPRARRVFDHRYIARLVAINLRNVQEERSSLDNFFGSAAPRTTQEMAQLFGAVAEDDDGITPRKANLALPPIGSK
jgi:CRP-like cAMP-binding protein